MIIAIIQARMGSRRLPGKVMLPLAGFPDVFHVYSRVALSKKIKRTVVATSKNPNNEPLIDFLKNEKVPYFLGSEEDVLSRFLEIVDFFNLADNHHVVRITADCPLIDYQIIDDVIKLHIESNSDYTSNTLDRTFPDGLDCEIIKVKTLKSLNKFALSQSHKEHVTSFITENTHLFKVANLKNNIDHSYMRWTLDNQEDYVFIKDVFDNLYPIKKDFKYQDILDYLNDGRKL